MYIPYSISLPLPYIPYFRPKRLKNHTLWGRTYLYGVYKGVPLPTGRACNRSSTRSLLVNLFLYFSHRKNKIDSGTVGGRDKQYYYLLEETPVTQYIYGKYSPERPIYKQHKALSPATFPLTGFSTFKVPRLFQFILYDSLCLFSF